MTITHATIANARELAYLINKAGEGIPFYLWEAMAEPGQSAIDVGILRAKRETGDFSYRNALIFSQKHTTAGMLLGYPLPDPYPAFDPAELPPVVLPMVELEARAAGSWYINALAVKDEHRRQGIARQLLQTAQTEARKSGIDLSIMVSSLNIPAKTLYLNFGFELQAHIAAVSFPGGPDYGNWELLRKQSIQP